MTKNCKACSGKLNEIPYQVELPDMLIRYFTCPVCLSVEEHVRRTITYVNHPGKHQEEEIAILTLVDLFLAKVLYPELVEAIMDVLSEAAKDVLFAQRFMKKTHNNS